MTIEALTADAATMIDEMLTSWDYAIGANDSWNNIDPMPDYWANAAAPAAACAMYDHVTGGSKYRARALASIEGSLATYATLPNGSFGPDPNDNSIDTMEFGKVMTMVMLLYGDQIDGAMWNRWANKLRGGCEYLRAHNNLRYYTNGNINIGNFMFLAFAYIVCGDAWIGQYAEKAWWTLHDPAASVPDPGWAGYGIVIDTVPTAPFDASHGETGYFTEEGGGGNGFDWDYAQYQMDELSLYYVITRDPRAVRLINMLINKAMPRVNQSDWTYNTMGGSRQGWQDPNTPRLLGFTTSALAVARLLLGRSDLPDPTDPEGQFYKSTGSPLGSITGAFGPGGSARPGGGQELAPGWHRGLYHSLGTFALALSSIPSPHFSMSLALTTSSTERARWIRPNP